jgi:predicted nucleotidyltransferase
MIVNQRHDTSIIGKLEKSEFSFYLTGSRFFGGYHPGSDWDYFVTDSLKVRGFLDSLGFSEDENLTLQQYDDSTIITVMSYNDIQIQLVKDANFKHEVQTLLLQTNGLHSVPKASRKFVWNYAVALHRLGESQEEIC